MAGSWQPRRFELTWRTGAGEAGAGAECACTAPRPSLLANPHPNNSNPHPSPDPTPTLTPTPNPNPNPTPNPNQGGVRAAVRLVQEGRRATGHPVGWGACGAPRRPGQVRAGDFSSSGSSSGSSSSSSSYVTFLSPLQVLVEGGKDGKQTRLRAADAADLERWLTRLPAVAPTGSPSSTGSGRGSGRASSFKAASRA